MWVKPAPSSAEEAAVLTTSPCSALPLVGHSCPSHPSQSRQINLRTKLLIHLNNSATGLLIRPNNSTTSGLAKMMRRSCRPCPLSPTQVQRRHLRHLLLHHFPQFLLWYTNTQIHSSLRCAIPVLVLPSGPTKAIQLTRDPSAQQTITNILIVLPLVYLLLLEIATLRLHSYPYQGVVRMQQLKVELGRSIHELVLQTQTIQELQIQERYR